MREAVNFAILDNLVKLVREQGRKPAYRDWCRRIEAGAASDNFIDALILTIEAYIRKNKSRRKNR